MSAATSEPTPTPALVTARAAVARGWRPFPVEFSGKRPAVGIRWGTATASEPPEQTLALWFGRDPVNVGIAAKGSGLVILDDDAGDGMIRLCEAYGQSVPVTYRVRTAKGWHWYFTAPEHVEIGNAPGLLADFGFDVRGGRGDGGYVVAAGSRHESGHVYVAEDDDADAVDMPWWLVELLLPDPEPAPAEPAPAPASSDRRYTMDQAIAWVERYGVGPLKAATEGHRNDRLNTAAVVAGHFVPEFWSAEFAGERLAEIAHEIGLDPSEIGPTIRSGLNRGMREPYSLVDPPAFASGASPPGETDEEVYARELAHEVRRERLRREARAVLATESREPLAVLDLDAFLDAPQVDYLVPGMLWRTGTSRIFGPPGETKSFLALDVALSLATGAPWRPGDDESADEPVTRHDERVVVHYVMAEGHAVNTARALAWFHYRRVPRERARATFRAIPQGVLLTPEGIADYLALVRRDRPGLVVLDTKARMMAGDENTAADSAVLVRAVDELREACDGNVCLIDHTGLVDITRARGSSAVLAAMDTEVRVTLDRDAGIATAEVTRDKAAEPGTSWSYRLHRVLGVPSLRPGTPTPAVPVPVAGGAAGGPFAGLHPAWWQDDIQVPDRVAQIGGSGSDAAREIFRVLFFVDDPDGVTFSEVRRAINARPGGKQYSEPTARRGKTLLMTAGVVQAVTRERVALTPAYWPGKAALS